MTQAMELSNKVALVAGGTGGIGRHIVHELGARGATVVTASRRQHDSPNHIPADLRSPEECQRVIDSVINQHGALDIVVNAVGVVAFGDVAATTVDTTEELFLTNVFTHIFLCGSALPHMNKGGVIVGISGVTAESNLPGMAVYGASKAAMRSFNDGFAREARRVGVRVVDARPPHTESGLAQHPIAGTAPRLPQGLEPSAVASRIVDAIVNGETDLSSTSFA